MLKLSHEDRQALLPHERDAAYELLAQAKYIAACLQMNRWPRAEKLAGFEAAIQDFSRAEQLGAVTIDASVPARDGRAGPSLRNGRQSDLASLCAYCGYLSCRCYDSNALRTSGE